MSAVAYAPMDLRTAEGMLSFVADCEDREIWLAMGMALKAEFGEAGFDAWDRWSQGGANYNAKACRASWRGFKARAGGVGIGTLIKFAKDGGYRFDSDSRPAPDVAELARRKAERAARVQAELKDRAALAQSAEANALSAWRTALRVGGSAYAVRKGIDQPESCRFLPLDQGGGLVVPMLRYDLPREHALKGVQIIRDDGTKKFTYGMEKPGTACRLGLPVVGEPVFVCEGYATGMSIRMALGRRYPVFVAFDAYNLPIVVESVHQALPGCPIVICADDDHATTIKGLPNNVGRIQAQIAMDSVMEDTPERRGARLVARCYPVFKPGTPREAKDTDFNDLHRLEGLDEVTQQMELTLDTIRGLKTHG